MRKHKVDATVALLQHNRLCRGAASLTELPKGRWGRLLIALIAFRVDKVQVRLRRRSKARNERSLKHIAIVGGVTLRSPETDTSSAPPGEWPGSTEPDLLG